ncbi:MAG TPA: hemin uptake protein HemP [Povalibacter sp.]|jgi:hemin uptake protein HemP|uniref:hemin uptake protein HemP n=1 Tax=Povalibacter sp. TaxID=1962978 RepID=UPI002CFF3326|nr:hemin uptake protein HemP [Povalibacter sp.]HMN45263.1 hemin uptake protein HemP [Povalibacter sp.]
MDAITAKPPIRSADISSPAPGLTRGPAIPCVRSDSLFGRSREILIEHGGCYYRLRLTHSNKLILTK